MDPTPPSSTSMPEHKLSGFLTSVLSLNVNPHERLPEINSPLEIFQEASEIRFRSSTGSILSPIAEPTDSTAVSSSYKKRKRMKGTVHGSISVVHQIYVLLLNKCLRIYARVIYIDVSDEVDHDARAVVLVDIYLPNAVCSGWQFPKSGSVAASLLRHISCDWALRSLLLSNYVCTDKKAIWNVCDCHVLGCKLNCGGLDSSKKKLFELHEIFKTLPSVSTERISCCSRIKPADSSSTSGIWELPDDVLINILAALGPVDLVRISLTCHHLKSLAAFIMPCMKLKLFPHQQAAVRWMLNRERNSQILSHPLYMHFTTEDGFAFFVNCISGEIITGVAPTIKDFHGGMFCDEPGLGKTITALSLILKTQGTLADPPDGVQVIWCTRDAVQKCGYYEINGCDADCSKSFSESTLVSQKARRGQFSIDEVTPRESLDFSPPKKARLTSNRSHLNYSDKCVDESPIAPTVQTCVRSSEGLSRIRRNLFDAYEEALTFSKENKNKKTSFRKRRVSSNLKHVSWADEVIIVNESVDDSGPNETWVQCDACRKWRKISSKETADTNVAWFCRMNPDPLYKSCNDPEESWDRHQPITYLPGFCSKGTSGGLEENVDFFTSVLKEHCSSLNLRTKKALTWLAKLSQIKLSEMETVGLIRPFTVSNGDAGYCRIFQAFGLHRKVEKGMSRWHYPRFLSNLDFDLAALRVALCKPLDVPRLYLSSATLIVVPANLVDHWRTQIQRHVRPGQLQVYVWTDNKKPSAHNLAWDYDVVITTFNRLSAEWGSRKSSALTQVHWLRVMLDEGHTLGSSLSLTNKLQMAISLSATNRWVLTGTPTPNTPNSQLSHLQPLLNFLHEEVYGKDHKSWDNGILKPFEAEMEEGRSRLLQLLYRSMISARKVDLQTIPPCIKKVRFLDFTEEHAKSYNELVVTIRRNILMADWNDPSHVESLLNPKQWKFRSSTIKNVRLSCCVAGHIKVTEAGEDIQETMDMLVGNGLDPISEEYAFIKDNILNGGNCLRCKEWCRLPFITPCRHLLCLGCVALDSEKCTVPGCGNLYEMQSPEILARPENPNPKWPVPKDLIELQPSYKQDNWDPDWQSTSSSKVSYLIKNLKELQEVNRSIIYHADQETVANSNGEPDLPVRDSDLHSFPHDIAKLRKDSSMLPDKVIIFSQFLEHIHVIEQQLTFAGIKFAGMYSPMHSCNKMKSLATFQHDDSCLALLMDGSAALGLDLSFVTHVFLMEPIWDRSMEEQVISRAHRMGAARPIHVETLAMRGTIEEQMLEFLQDDDGCRRLLKLELGKGESEGPRPRRTLHDFAESNYLVQLSFVQTSVK